MDFQSLWEPCCLRPEVENDNSGLIEAIDIKFKDFSKTMKWMKKAD